MTRFQRELGGLLGGYWKKNAEKEAEAAVRKADEEAIVEEDGAIKWKTNGSYLMDDFCEKLEYKGYPFSRAKTGEKRDRQVEESLKEYRASHNSLSDEAAAEARAAFGSGVTVVDVLTGRSMTT